METKQEFLTVEEVASILRVTKHTVCRWLRDKRIRGVKIGGWRIPRSEIEALEAGK